MRIVEKLKKFCEFFTFKVLLNTLKAASLLALWAGAGSW